MRYEYRDVPQNLSSQDRVDQWFDVKTRGLSSRAKAKLKEKWGTIQKVYSSRSRLEKVAWDIIQDFNMKPRLMDGNGNAILVADGIPTACKYYEIFQQMGFKKCAIISSYTPNKGELRTDTVSDEDDTETFLKYETYLKMLGLDPSDLPNAGSVQAKVEEFEKEAKRKFVEEPANMKLLIVVDKLLTGFDAPPCTYLYIDKRMQDHGLFQAICRVNRLDDDSKDFGYIVDYKQLFGQLQTAMKDYTSGAFEGYDPEDVKGLVKDRHDATVSYFEEVYDAVEELCEGVEEPRGEIQYIHYFCGVSGQSEESDEIYARLREKLYRLVSSLVRAFAEAKPYLVDDISSGKLNEYDKKVTFYIELKKTIGTASGDFLDLKAYDAYVKEEYRKILKEEIEKRLPKWETQTGLKCDSWQTKYMVTKWGACSTDKKKLWFNLQLAQKPYACLDYIILHELTHLITRKHDATFIAHMDRHMPNWREIRKELNDSRLDYYEAQDESPLQKLIDQSRYDDIRDAAIAPSMLRINGPCSKNIISVMWRPKWASSRGLQSFRYQFKSGMNTTWTKKSTTVVYV